MLRNATRELERRRRMPHDLFHRPLISYLICSQGCNHHGFASQVAVATRHYDTNTSGFEQHGGLTEGLTASPRKCPTVGTSTRFRKHTPLSLQGECSGSLSNRNFPRWDAQPTRSLDRRYGVRRRTHDHNEFLAKKADFRYENEPVDVGDLPETLECQHPSRQVGPRHKLKKSWGSLTPNLLLKRVLEPDADSQHWKTQAAITRSMRLPIVLLQMLLRKEPQLPGQETLLNLLPTPQEWDEIMDIVHRNGHKPEDLDYYLYVLEGKTDNVRCQRFLERDSYKPTFILNFLIRESSTFTEVKTLSSLIEYCRKSCTNAIRRKWGAQQSHPTRDIRPADLDLTMTMLAYHCLRLEPRLMPKLAEIAVQYIEAIATFPIPPGKIYESQCVVFNNTLRLFRPQPRMQAAQRASPNAFFWEAQRILLAMSAGLEQPLHVGREGFRAIRDALAGLPKNQTEMHSSSRHAATWPPYLQPGDGMDETTDPEDNWSRAVQAGMLMQEAGFAKEERDDAVDILQGMSPDGTPTIQLRTALDKDRSLSIWEASIRATRNAQEAWQRFRNPPEAGLKPGPPQYAAMFEKLMLREADTHSRCLPGDKALNFPTQQEANLAEFERARLQPPSVAQLYQQMRLDGIHPKDACLRVLVANAESLDTAHRYLGESTEDNIVIHALMTGDSDSEVLKEIDIGLFSAYIQVLTRQERRTAKHMMRAIRITGVRLDSDQSPWVEFIWGSILKNLSQHHGALRISLAEQLRLFFYAIEQIDGRHGVPLSTFAQLNKCMRKAAKWELVQLLADLTSDDSEAECNSMRFLYDRRSRDREERQQVLLELGPGPESPNLLLSKGTARMKELFNTLTAQEKESQGLLGAYHVAALDRMMWRKDPVRSEHAYGYMLSLAYVGEFEEMAKVLRWLIEEWGQPDVVEALSELDEPPPYADFSEPLCAFRLFAEPMLEDGVVESLQEAIGEAGLDWTWPDDEAVKAYAEMQEDESIAALARVLEWVRHREWTGQEAEAEASQE